MPTQDQLIAELTKVSDPELGRNIVELGMVKDLKITAAGLVTFTLALTIPGCPMKSQMERDARMALLSVEGVKEVKITFGAMSEEERRKVLGNAQPQLPKLNQFNHIKKVIAVLSGKGGVGKSSVAALLACELARAGKKVGILDADITGPSIPRLFGLPAGGLRGSDQGILPAVTKLGIKVISTNLMVPDENVGRHLARADDLGHDPAVLGRGALGHAGCTAGGPTPRHFGCCPHRNAVHPGRRGGAGLHAAAAGRHGRAQSRFHAQAVEDPGAGSGGEHELLSLPG